MSEVIVITSGKGGVGKTTTTANIGTGLAQLNKKVVMIDTDIGLRNLDVVMGLENRIVYNLVDVVEGKCRIRQALIKDKKYPDSVSASISPDKGQGCCYTGADGCSLSMSFVRSLTIFCLTARQVSSRASRMPLQELTVHLLSLHLRYQQSVTLTVLLAFSRQMR